MYIYIYIYVYLSPSLCVYFEKYKRTYIYICMK